MEIEIRRPFRKEEGKSRFRATYYVSDVPAPGCIHVTITLAVRIQLSQEIARHGIKYTDALLGECAKELVAAYVFTGGSLDPDCDPGRLSDAIFVDYGDFDLFVTAATTLTAQEG